MSEALKVIFMGTPDLALSVLDALLDSKHEVIAIYSQPPKPAGRGKKLKKSPVQLRAEELNIPIYTPKSLKKSADAKAEFAALGADVGVVAAYGLILPQEVLDAPKYGCINIHASLLPRWRGAAPINHAIWAGDDKSGVCIMQMDAGLDTGHVLMRGEIPITNKTTAPILHDQLAEQGRDLIVKMLDLIVEGNAPEPEVQQEEDMTYASMLSKADGKINWTETAAEIDRQIRALNPWPGTWCMVGDKRLKILDAKIIDGNGNAGVVLDKNLTIACGEGALLLTKVQPENKKPMDGVSFMNGSHINIGEVLL